MREAHSLKAAARAIEFGGDNRKDLAIGLSAIGPYHPAMMGALGENQFDGNGDMVRDMLMYVVKDGAAVFYK